MFKDLYAIARHTPLHLIITPNGPQLRIIVTPKPSGAGDSSALAKPFSVAGTPEELDAEFPAALAQYAGAVSEVRKSLDLPLDALEAEKKKTAKREEKKAERERQQKEAEEKRKAAAAQAAKTRAENAAKKKAEDAARAQQRAAKRAAKKNAPAELPGATEPLPENPAATWPFPTGSRAIAAAGETEPRHRPELPGKTECVRDYQQLKLQHGDKLTRRLFIKKAATGRRYEKLWPNWEKFVKEAGAQQALPLEQTRGEAAERPHTAPVSGSTPDPRPETAAAEGDGAGSGVAASDANAARAAHPVIPIVPAEDAGDAAHDGDAPPRKGHGTGTHADVYDEAGNYLSSITTRPAIGEHIGLVTHKHLLRVVKSEARPSGGLDLTVVPDPEETARRAQAVADRVRAQAEERRAAERPRCSVYDEVTGELVAEYKWAPAVGERLTPDGQSHPYRITFVEGSRAHARRILPTKNRLVAEHTGELLGHTEAIYEVTDPVEELAGKEYRVVKVELDAYVVKAAKPRVKGPAALTEPAVAAPAEE